MFKCTQKTQLDKFNSIWRKANFRVLHPTKTSNYVQDVLTPQLLIGNTFLTPSYVDTSEILDVVPIATDG